ncbi:S9 family peptidase [Glycomyces xiaoerkulensis]|uniref:S9 family peptidase n=1 Tax=Glycomyces xiaoerkulensis TaxID=2038139 RepID=UPI0013000EB6|nr:alpha/beta fold hydrolase [Glycomyces xiaoerkulensis]
MTSLPKEELSGSRRLNFRFSPNGTRATCLVASADGRLDVETWLLIQGGVRVRRVRFGTGSAAAVQPLPTDGGAVVLVHASGSRREVGLLPAEGRTGPPVTLAELDCRGLRAVPSTDPETLAWLVAIHGTGRSALHRVDAATRSVTPMMEVPGLIAGERVLSEDGWLLAADVVADRRRRIGLIDLRRRSMRLLDAPGRVALTDPAGGRVLVAGPGDRDRLSWIDPSNEGERVPLPLPDTAEPPRPIAVSPDGGAVALAVTTGIRDGLVVCDRTGAASRPTVPDGVIGPAAWSDAGLRVLLSTPQDPLVLATMDRRLNVAVGSPGPRPDTTTDARGERFPGEVGDIEAVVYGPDWRHSRHALVALHGGPESHWNLANRPFLRHLAEAGIAVIAPNQRGSTGYGAAHRTAIVGAWGGPDLADVLRLRAAVADQRGDRREAPMLLGTSYGAFLALLAVAAEPHAWSRCAALAPFTSARSLERHGPPQIRAQVRRLRGLRAVDDELGERDLLRLSDRIRVPLLIGHGRSDERVPPSQSRALADRLRATGHDRLSYRTYAGAGHHLLDDPGADRVEADLLDFLCGRSAPDHLTQGPQP